jgi:hypothetical protein
MSAGEEEQTSVPPEAPVPVGQLAALEPVPEQPCGAHQGPVGFLVEVPGKGVVLVDSLWLAAHARAIDEHNAAMRVLWEKKQRLRGGAYEPAR